MAEGSEAHGNCSGESEVEFSHLATNAQPRPLARAWRLFINDRFTGVLVFPDGRHPNMWRIYVDGRVSDQVNLTRARDAAIAWARPRGLGGDETARWKPSGKPAAASLVRQIEAT